MASCTLMSVLAQRLRKGVACFVVPRLARGLCTSNGRTFVSPLDQFEVVTNPGHEKWLEVLPSFYRENWSPSKNAYNVWMRGLGPENFKCIFALDKESKEIAAAVLVALHRSVQNSPALVTVGDFWVQPALRGQGLGLALWNFAFHFPHFQGLNRGLMAGTPHMIDKYTNAGYDKFLQAKALTILAHTNDIDLEAIGQSPPTGVSLVPFAEAEESKVLRFDQKVAGGLRRDSFVKAWMLAEHVITSLVAVDAEQQVVGFASLLAGPGDRLSLCPWYADSQPIAELLLKECLSQANLAKHDVVRFMPYSTNQAALDLIDRITHGKAERRRASQGQFTQTVLPVAYQKVFSVFETALNVV